MAPPDSSADSDKHDSCPTPFCLQKFRLYESFSNFYLVGRGKDKSLWRVMKIDRMEPSELNIYQDSVLYSAKECSELLNRLHEGNKSTGGLKLLTICYGIVGFVKFLEPHYMLVVTERKKLGAILGEKIYGIAQSKMIAIPNPVVLSEKAYCREENRYKKLLNMVDLTKDFFFSYSYHIMRSLQKNMMDSKTGQFIYETMFVWNEFLTRDVRKRLENTHWTVALVYGFFKQIKLCVPRRDLSLILIARRSRHYAGTRFLRRGVNESGRVANDVETEQIVFEESTDGHTIQISSVVQNRGSIPLLWSQETSLLNIFKPVIILPKQDDYKATKLHFRNLVYRYGNPIIILDLTKTREKVPRETILRTEYANAIGCINADYSEKNRLKFLQWDLKQHSRNEATFVLEQLIQLTTVALNITGIFFGKAGPNLLLEVDGHGCKVEVKISESASGNNCVTPLMLQNGILRTNCIDCLDRTNFGQFAYGISALGYQLKAFGILELSRIGVNDPLARELMSTYEIMGDKLALQYGGSPAHNKIFCKIRDEWQPAIEYLDVIKSVQRFVSNAYKDSEKQNAIDVFLGNPPPEKRKIEFDPDRNTNPQRFSLLRSLSDSSILWEDGVPKMNLDATKQKQPLAELLPELPTFSRCPPSDFLDVDWRSESANSYIEDETYERTVSSKFLEMDWNSESACFHEDYIYERFFSRFSPEEVSLASVDAPSEETVESLAFDLGKWIASGGTIFS